jgi:hypothetical protein
MTPGSTYRPATLQPPCLGREPRLGLRQTLLHKNLMRRKIGWSFLSCSFCISKVDAINVNSIIVCNEC